jgi:hypothetical protein
MACIGALSGHPCSGDVSFRGRVSHVGRGRSTRDAITAHAPLSLRNKWCRTLLCICFFFPCLVSFVAIRPSSASFLFLSFPSSSFPFLFQHVRRQMPFFTSYDQNTTSALRCGRSANFLRLMLRRTASLSRYSTKRVRSPARAHPATCRSEVIEERGQDSRVLLQVGVANVDEGEVGGQK